MNYVILDCFSEENREIWDKISLFEKQFEYPMGNKTFSIQHGRNSYYPKFFEQIGDYYKTIVIYENEEIICTITGVVQNEIAYICDNKVSRNVKDKNKLLKDIFCTLNEELNLNNCFYFINMSPPERNPILTLIERKFGFKLNVSTQYIREYSKADLSGDMYVGTNMGIKDIIIENNVLQLYHLNSGDISVKDIPDTSLILETTDTLTENSYPITVASHNCNIQDLVKTIWI